MNTNTIREFRENLRHFERELNLQNGSNCFNGVSLSQCHTLLELFSHNNITINELSDRLYLDKSTISRTVEGLVRSGLVSRTIPRENRRISIISLTQEGKNVCDWINTEKDSYFKAIMEAIPVEDQPVFLRSFEKMAKKMIQSNKGKTENC